MVEAARASTPAFPPWIEGWLIGRPAVLNEHSPAPRKRRILSSRTRLPRGNRLARIPFFKYTLAQRRAGIIGQRRTPKARGPSHLTRGKTLHMRNGPGKQDTQVYRLAPLGFAYNWSVLVGICMYPPARKSNYEMVAAAPKNRFSKRQTCSMFPAMLI